MINYIKIVMKIVKIWHQCPQSSEKILGKNQREKKHKNTTHNKTRLKVSIIKGKKKGR